MLPGSQIILILENLIVAHTLKKLGALWKTHIQSAAKAGLL